MKVLEYKYVCAKCGADDKVKMFEGEGRPPVAVNCWKCHAGSGKEFPEMFSERNGMFPAKA